MKKLKNNNHTSQHSHHTTQKGITLVALVITIIVLLILAGVAINMAINSDGLFGKANEAADKWNTAVQNEQQSLAGLQDILSELETGVKVEKVIDEAPGVLETDATEENTYIINSIEDLVFFSYDVKQGNTYVDKTVKLGVSLDFNSTKSYVDAFRKDYSKYGYNGALQLALTTGEGFQSIGTIEDIKDGTSCFQGTFDGNNNSILNLYINGVFGQNDVNIIGLFGTNNGTIKNLKLENVKITASTNTSTILVAGIAGRNYGTITQCAVSGEMKLTNNSNSQIIYGGGVVAQGSTGSIINKCVNKSNISYRVTDAGIADIGGIVALEQGNGIELCCNLGDIYFIDNVGKSKTGIIGGIVRRS